MDSFVAAIHVEPERAELFFDLLHLELWWFIRKHVLIIQVFMYPPHAVPEQLEPPVTTLKPEGHE